MGAFITERRNAGNSAIVGDEVPDKEGGALRKDHNATNECNQKKNLIRPDW